MIIKKDDSVKKMNTKNCTVWEYDLKKANIGFAIANIVGKYPDSGFVKNVESDELYYVKTGKCIVEIEDKVHEMSEGDLLLIEKNKKYKVNGNVELVVVNQPKWSKEQYKVGL